MMNKRGKIILRDIMFMIIVFGGILALSSLFVYNMSDEYENTNMRGEYTNLTGGVGDNLLFHVGSDIETMRNATESSGEDKGSLLGSFTSITGIVQGAATILKAVIFAPVYIKDALILMFNSMGVPSLISTIVLNMIMYSIYVIIVFVIVSSLLKGGEV